MSKEYKIAQYKILFGYLRDKWVICSLRECNTSHFTMSWVCLGGTIIFGGNGIFVDEKKIVWCKFWRG